MKIVDMFGCELPVCALNFAWYVHLILDYLTNQIKSTTPSLDELVKDGKNGLIFTSPLELSQQIETLLTSFPSPHGPLANLRASLLESSRAPSASASASAPAVNPSLNTDTGDGDHWEWNSWDDNWNKVVRPLVLRDTNGYHDEWVM
jgi:beta-1,4-mannosyltransferase